MKKTRILFEGHDLKFLTHVIRHFTSIAGYEVEVMTYPGHILKDPEQVYKVISRFDVIFSEWGLGNLTWFSRHKIPGQKLITRIHLQEFFTSYLSETHWENVDSIIFVGPRMRETFVQQFPGLTEKCHVIPNLIDTHTFDLKKQEDYPFNLGLLGILPMRKSPHLGLKILKELRKKDKRFKLFIKGKRAEEVDWLWRKPAEQEYYKQFYESIETMGLQDAVFFDPHGNDVPQWFTKIGFILSTSEFESFHMAIAEGMASGTIPVIRNWEGADALFPARYFFTNTDEAVQIITGFSSEKSLQKEAGMVKSFCREHFDTGKILPLYEELFQFEMDPCSLREEYRKRTVSGEQLLKETVEAKKESEFLRQRMEEQARLHEELLRQHNSLTGEHGSLIEQQKVLLGNNQRLTAEMAALNSDIQRREKENKVITGELNATKQEIAVLQNELSGKKVQNQSLTEEAGRNRNEILLLTTENVTLKNDLGNTTEKLREKSVEHATSLKTAAGQMDRLRTSLMKLENENLEQKRKLDEIYKSLTWKVGSFLIRKPADLFRRKR